MRTSRGRHHVGRVLTSAIALKIIIDSMLVVRNPWSLSTSPQLWWHCYSLPSQQRDGGDGGPKSCPHHIIEKKEDICCSRDRDVIEYVMCLAVLAEFSVWHGSNVSANLEEAVDNFCVVSLALALLGCVFPWRRPLRNSLHPSQNFIYEVSYEYGCIVWLIFLHRDWNSFVIGSCSFRQDSQSM